MLFQIFIAEGEGEAIRVDQEGKSALVAALRAGAAALTAALPGLTEVVAAPRPDHAAARVGLRVDTEMASGRAGGAKAWAADSASRFSMSDSPAASAETRTDFTATLR